MDVTPSDFSMENFVIGKIRGIRADQRNIGAVQRGDEREPAFRREHLLREQRGDGVRNRVVDVQQIEVVGFGHVHHARGQRQAIGRILKQRIVGNLDLVIVNARRAGIEADGIRVGDEVDFVPAIGELEAEFRRDDAAAAVGGITVMPIFMLAANARSRE